MKEKGSGNGQEVGLCQKACPEVPEWHEFIVDGNQYIITQDDRQIRADLFYRDNDAFVSFTEVIAQAYEVAIRGPGAQSILQEMSLLI